MVAVLVSLSLQTPVCKWPVEFLYRESVWPIEFRKKKTESILGVIYLSPSLTHFFVTGRVSLQKVGMAN